MNKQYKVVFFDTECFMFNWLMCFTEMWLENGEIKTREFEIIDDRKKLMKYYYENYKYCIFVAHNGSRYDIPMLISIMEGCNPHEINNKLINGKEHWKMSNFIPNWKNYTIYYIDTNQDASKLPLKAYEGYVGLPIVTTEVDFNLNRKLTAEEIQLTVKYCRADVNALISLFKTILGGIMTKLRLIDRYNLPLDTISKTNAQLVATLLGKGFVEVFDDAKDPFDFSLIPVKPKTQQIVDFFSQPVVDGNTYNIMLAGVWITYAYGGAHAALPNFKYEGEMWMYDISSLYPSIMIYYNFFSRNISKEKRRMYVETYFDRLACKCKNNSELKKVRERELNFFKTHTEYGEFVDNTDYSIEHKPNKQQANDAKLVLKYWAQV